VVLLDIGMPKLNGYDTCRRIRAEPWGNRMVLIALTGWGQEQDRRRTEDAGFDAHVVKPVDWNALLTLLGQLGSAQRSERRTHLRRE
jgi:CheY-like chemotaxis protein